MLGSLRTFLALVVAAGHLSGIFLGVHAVYGFYVISGFLMTRIVNERYGYSRRGFSLYLLNRFLRIYPAYWLACLVGLALVIALGDEWNSSFQRNLKLPEDPVAWLALWANWYWQPDNVSHLVPPSWAIAVEFLFYLLIGLGLARSKQIVLIWLMVSIGYHLLALEFGWDRYYSPLAAMLPYALGAWVYHARDACSSWLARNTRHLLLGLLPLYALIILSNPLASLQGIQMTWLFYLGVGVSALTVAVLSQDRTFELHSSRDTGIGNLSYPIYLFHYPCGAVVVAMFDLPPKSLGTFFAALPLMLITSRLISHMNEAAVEKWRKKISRHAQRYFAEMA